MSQRAVFYRGTGRFLAQGHQPKEENFEIVRNNEICEPQFLPDHVACGRSIFINGERENGLDMRLNSLGDTADAATGYQIVTDTLTYIKKQVTAQKFYKVAPGKFIPVVEGDGSFAANLLTNRSYEVGEDFEAGNLRQGASDARVSSNDVAIDGVTAPVQNWAKGIRYSIFEINEALRANNWDPVEGRMRSRKTNWDLGVQVTSFLGLETDARFPGLLNNPNITVDTASIPQMIGTMSAAQLQTFVTGLIATYFTQTNSAMMPNRFIVPYDDFFAMQALTPGTLGTYPVPIIDYITNAFKKAVAEFESDFKILPLAYADKLNAANVNRGINKNLYLLYNFDPENVRMDIPVPYTTTQANSVDNFTFHNVSYGSYTGTIYYRNQSARLFTN